MEYQIHYQVSSCKCCSKVVYKWILVQMVAMPVPEVEEQSIEGVFFMEKHQESITLLEFSQPENSHLFNGS